MSVADLELLRKEEAIRASFESEDLVGEAAEPNYNLINLFERPDLFVASHELSPMYLCQHRKVVPGYVTETLHLII